MKKIVTFATVCAVLFLSSAFTNVSSDNATVQPVVLQNAPIVSDGEPQPHPQTIYVKTRINGNTVLLPELVFFTDLVGWVKQDIAYQLDIPIDSFELTFGGAILDEELSLNAYGITTNSILGLRYL